MVDASAAAGTAGELLLDPKNITVADGGGAAVIDGDAYADGGGTNSITIDPASIEAIVSVGTGVTLQANNDITISDAIVSTGSGVMTFEAGRSIAVDGAIQTNNSHIFFSFNDPDATALYRDAGAASFVNNALINAGTGSVYITAGNTTDNNAANVTTGIVYADDLRITHSETDAGGVVTLNGITINDDLIINASTGDVDILNTTANGSIRVVGNTQLTTGGDVSILGTNTDLEDFGVTANNVALYDKKAIELGSPGFVSNIAGTLTLDIYGPIGNQGEINVAGKTTITTYDGGFGIDESNITLNNSLNDFGEVSITQDWTGNSVVIDDENDLDLDGTFRGDLTVDAGGAVQVEGTVGDDLWIYAGGGMTDSAALSVVDEMHLWAENDTDIVFDETG
ncbi:MAG: hypothetical protein C0618_11890, partial [Desulfuromonas sp.]